MIEKKCFKCNTVKPLDDFYKHPRMKDGHVNKCKECNKRDVQQVRNGNVEYYREYDRARSDDPKRVQARKDYAERMKNDPIAKEKKKLYTKKYQDKHAIKRAAHLILGYEVKKGNITLTPCKKCFNTDDLNAHHEDYTKPLDIVWLCKTCHGKRHREINEEIRNGADYSDRGF